jgi:hypothetical protein
MAGIESWRSGFRAMTLQMSHHWSLLAEH